MKNVSYTVKLATLACALLSQMIQADHPWGYDVMHVLYNQTDKPITFTQAADIGLGKQTISSKLTTIPPKSFIGVPVRYDNFLNNQRGVKGLAWSDDIARQLGRYFNSSLIMFEKAAMDGSYEERNSIVADEVTMTPKGVPTYKIAVPRKIKGLGAIDKLIEMGLKDESNLSNQLKRIEVTFMLYNLSDNYATFNMVNVDANGKTTPTNWGFSVHGKSLSSCTVTYYVSGNHLFKIKNLPVSANVDNTTLKSIDKIFESIKSGIYEQGAVIDKSTIAYEVTVLPGNKGSFALYQAPAFVGKNAAAECKKAIDSVKKKG